MLLDPPSLPGVVRPERQKVRAAQPVRVKPLLRGIPDVIASAAALPAAAYLVGNARPGAATVAALVYAATLVALFAVSATYHTPMWPLNVRAWMRRADHSMIYVLIAGSYTPVCLTVLPAHIGIPLLWAVWIYAAAGITKVFAWPTSPRWLNVVSYIVLGWFVAPYLGATYAGFGLTGFVLLAAGGFAYTVGAVIYARRWPNPVPTVFGYHEVFHVFVIGAATCHYAAMWGLLT